MVRSVTGDTQKGQGKISGPEQKRQLGVVHQRTDFTDLRVASSLSQSSVIQNFRRWRPLQKLNALQGGSSFSIWLNFSFGYRGVALLSESRIAQSYC